MFIPLRTDRPTRRRPAVTESLIIANMAIYLLGLAGHYFGWFDIDRFVAGGWLDGRDFRVWNLVSYQFLHDPGGIFHLLFNMVFLWIFGGAVEDRIGRFGFLGFYLIGGAVAGIAHMQISNAPVIGASGSIAGVTGAFLALFPRSHIKVLVIFFIIGVFEVPALWFIGLFFMLDVLQQTMQLFGSLERNTAFMAHIAGYLYGFFLAFTLLALQIIRYDDYDVFFLFRQARRRAAFRTASKGDVRGLYEGHSADTGKRVEKQLQKKATKLAAEADQQLMEARTEINRLHAAHELAAAASRYRQLLENHPDATFPEDRQLDLANQLYADEHHEAAAKAYELYLGSYPHAARSDEVRLLLGMLYARQLRKPQRARELIEAAKAKLLEPGQSRLADDLLSELGA